MMCSNWIVYYIVKNDDPSYLINRSRQEESFLEFETINVIFFVSTHAVYAWRLSTIPTWIVCLPYQHEAWCFMQSIARVGHDDGNNACFFMEVKVVSVFPKDTTMHCSVQEPNQQPATLRSPFYALLLWAATATSWNISVNCPSQEHNNALSPIWASN